MILNDPRCWAQHSPSPICSICESERQPLQANLRQIDAPRDGIRRHEHCARAGLERPQRLGTLCVHTTRMRGTQIVFQSNDIGMRRPANVQNTQKQTAEQTARASGNIPLNSQETARDVSWAPRNRRRGQNTQKQRCAKTMRNMHRTSVCAIMRENSPTPPREEAFPEPGCSTSNNCKSSRWSNNPHRTQAQIKNEAHDGAAGCSGATVYGSMCSGLCSG